MSGVFANAPGDRGSIEGRVIAKIQKMVLDAALLSTQLYHIYQPLCSGRIWHKVNFLAEFNRFEFSVFLLLDE